MHAEARRLPGPLPMLSVFDRRRIEFCGLNRFVSLCRDASPAPTPPPAAEAAAAAGRLPRSRQLLSLPLFSCRCSSSSGAQMLSSNRLDGRFFELLRRKRCLKQLDDGGGASGRRSLDELPLVEATLPPPPPAPPSAAAPTEAPVLPIVELNEPPSDDRSDRFKLWLWLWL